MATAVLDNPVKRAPVKAPRRKSAAESVYPTQRDEDFVPGSEILLKLRQHLDARLNALRNDRMSWWTHWREIADYLIPRRYKWLITPNQGNRGSPINQKIVDNTATVALRVLAAGMMSGITSPGKPWFRLTVEDDLLADDPDVKLWLEEVQTRMSRVFAESNFYTSLATMYMDLGAFGTAVLIIDEDYEDVIRCVSACAGEYFLANGPRGSADTMYREYVQTVEQVSRKYGRDSCSESVLSSVKTAGAALTREIRVGYAVEPNSDMLPGVPGLLGMPWRILTWELGQSHDKLLERRGAQEQPFIAPRWDVVGNDAYGRSPGMDSLGDTKALQIEQKRKAQAIDKHVNPPMIADASMRNEPATLLPGGVTYVQSAANTVGFKPVYEIAPDISGLVEDIKEVQERVKTTYFTDLFMMISQLDTVRTATEIDARKEEKLIQLGPVLERFENEALDPAIDRTFNIMLRGGLLPPVPPALARRGGHIKVEYVSILAEAQKAVSTGAIERLAAFVGNLAGANPAVLDNIDMDEAVDIYANLLGVSPKIIVATRKVLQIRAQRAKQVQAQQQMQQTMAQVQGAQTLSQTPIGGNTALSKMLGNA